MCICVSCVIFVFELNVKSIKLYVDYLFLCTKMFCKLSTAFRFKMFIGVHLKITTDLCRKVLFFSDKAFFKDLISRHSF